MSILDLEVIKKFALTCNDGYEQGWHEGNGGNLSYRMTAEEVEACKPYFTYDRPWVDLGVQADNLKKEYFMVTGTGKFFQNVKRDPAANMCILEINDAGDGYRIVWGLVNGGGPTSAIPAVQATRVCGTRKTDIRPTSFSRLSTREWSMLSTRNSREIFFRSAQRQARSQPSLPQ